MTFYIYELYIENEIEPFYVGYSKNPSERLYRHIRDASGVEKHLRKARKILKAISENKQILSKTVFETDLFDEILLKEKELIAFYGRLDLGTGILYNLTDGGDGHTNYKWSQEACDRKSQSMIGVSKNKGNKRPDASERMSIPIFVYNQDGSFFKEYKSQLEACKDLNLMPQSISKCLRGKCKYTSNGKSAFQFSKTFVNQMPKIETTILDIKEEKPAKIFKQSDEHRQKLSENNGNKSSQNRIDEIKRLSAQGLNASEIQKIIGGGKYSIYKYSK